MSSLPAIQLSTDQYIKQAVTDLQKETKVKNPFELSRIEKISINIGVGNKFDNKQKQEIADYLMALSAQKPKKVKTNKSISSFKIRAGDVVGLVSTLRGKKMQDFLLYLIYISLPRSRDFKGISSTSFNGDYSCYSLGIENCSIFPAIGFDTSLNFGMQINIVFKEGKEENKLFLQSLRFPFKKEEAQNA